MPLPWEMSLGIHREKFLIPTLLLGIQIIPMLNFQFRLSKIYVGIQFFPVHGNKSLPVAQSGLDIDRCITCYSFKKSTLIEH